MTRYLQARALCHYFRTVLYCERRVNRPGVYRKRFAIATVLALVGCQAQPIALDGVGIPNEASVAGTQWLLEDLAGRGVLDRLQSTLRFAETGRVSGRAGCNDFSGPIRWGGRSNHNRSPDGHAKGLQSGRHRSGGPLSRCPGRCTTGSIRWPIPADRHGSRWQTPAIQQDALIPRTRAQPQAGCCLRPADNRQTAARAKSASMRCWRRAAPG